MNYAWRLAFEPGFWSLEAMTPYTAPWAHYWAALWMKAFGPSLVVFRASQIFLSVTGIFFFALALWQRGLRAQACFFLFVLALLPALLFNHRFSIELTGFHLLAFGVGAWALTHRLFWLVALAWVAGTTAHILFYGMGLALAATWISLGKEIGAKERRSGLVALLLLALFFLKVTLELPEKGKPLALLASALGMAALLLQRAEGWRFWRARFWDWLALVAAVPFVFNALFFAEGSWPLAVAKGIESWRGVGGIIFAVFFLLFAFGAWRGFRLLDQTWQRWFLLSVTCLGLMMLKPTPRYFEIPIFCLSFFFALGLFSLPRWQKNLSMVFLLGHALWLYGLYFHLPVRDASLRLLFFKDSSRDFLAKQELVSQLAGCRLSDIKLVDSRVREALVALERSDWSANEGTCPWKEINIAFRSEFVGRSTKEVAEFILWESQ